jgi:hypothetical protein
MRVCLLKLIIGDLRGWHIESLEHLEASADHRRWAAEVIFCYTGVFVGFEILLQDHCVDESGEANPVVFRQG